MGYVMKIRELVSDFLIVAGCGALVYGVYQVSIAAAWIVGGIALAVIGFAFGLEVRK